MECQIRVVADSDLKKLKSDGKKSKYQTLCSIPTRLANEYEFETSDHIRIDQPPYATYYKIHDIHETPTDAIRVHELGYPRFGGDQERTVEVSATIPQETPEKAKEAGGLAETMHESPSGQETILVQAPHGGSVEKGTDRIARQTFQLLTDAGVPSTLWMLRGYRPQTVPMDVSSHRVWHVGMPVHAARGYPQFQQLIERRFDHVVSFHRCAYDRIDVGGRVSEDLRKTVSDRLENTIGVDTYTTKEEMKISGTSPYVSTNYLSRNGGLHLECGPKICNNKGTDVAEVVAQVLLEQDSICER